MLPTNVSFRHIILASVGIFILALAGVVVIFLCLAKRNVPATDLMLETAKGLIGLATAAVVTLAVPLALAEYNRSRDEAEKERERERVRQDQVTAFRRDIISRLVRAYSDTKRARRSLRAQGLTQTYSGIDLKKLSDCNLDAIGDALDKYMPTLSDIELDLETVRQDLRTSTGAFTKQDSLIRHIERMEEYLSDLVKEYQKGRVKFRGQPPTLPVGSLKRFADFVAPSKQEPEYLSKLREGYVQALTLMRADLFAVDPNLVAKVSDSQPGVSLEGSPSSVTQKEPL